MGFRKYNNHSDKTYSNPSNLHQQPTYQVPQPSKWALVIKQTHGQHAESWGPSL